MQYAVFKICHGAPLVFVLHGFCERKRPKAIQNQLPAWLKGAKNVSVVAPMLMSGLWDETQVYNNVKQVCQEANASSVRLIGISIGGSAAWNLVATHPTLFETVIIISASPEPSLALDGLLRLFGLAIKRRRQPDVCATHVVAVNGVFDPLFCLSGVRLPRHAVRVRFCSRGHQVWDLAFRDERVQELLVGTIAAKRKAARAVAYQQVT